MRSVENLNLNVDLMDGVPIISSALDTISSVEMFKKLSNKKF